MKAKDRKRLESAEMVVIHAAILWRRSTIAYAERDFSNYNSKARKELLDATERLDVLRNVLLNEIVKVVDT